MPKPTIHSDRWPMLVVTWPPELRLEDIDAHFEEIIEYARRGEAFAVVMDARQGQKMDAVQRKRVAERLQGLTGVARLAGVAYVADSSLVRGVLTALNWIFPPPFKTKVFTNYQQAESWAMARLRAAA